MERAEFPSPSSPDLNEFNTVCGEKKNLTTKQPTHNIREDLIYWFIYFWKRPSILPFVLSLHDPVCE